MNFVNIAAGILVIFTVLAGVDMFRHFWGRRRARKAQERAESLQQRLRSTRCSARPLRQSRRRSAAGYVWAVTSFRGPASGLIARGPCEYR